ncbi:MAG: hypothetical protein ACOZCO_04020 [Bacteroidota bacterium]
MINLILEAFFILVICLLVVRVFTRYLKTQQRKRKPSKFESRYKQHWRK